MNMRIPLFQKKDCIERWSHSSPHASDNVDIFKDVLRNAIDGIVDEDIDKGKETEDNEKVEL